MVRSCTRQKLGPEQRSGHTARTAQGPAWHINSNTHSKTLIAVQNLLILKGFLQIHNYTKANPHHKAVKTTFTQS